MTAFICRLLQDSYLPRHPRSGAYLFVNSFCHAKLSASFSIMIDVRLETFPGIQACNRATALCEGTLGLTSPCPSGFLLFRRRQHQKAWPPGLILNQEPHRQSARHALCTKWSCTICIRPKTRWAKGIVSTVSLSSNDGTSRSVSDTQVMIPSG